MPNRSRPYMPVMGGLEATRLIHKLPQCRSLPIFAMTAAVMEDDRERCRQAGMLGVIPKPVEPEDLAKALRMCVGSGLGLHADMPGAAAEPDSAVVDMVKGLRRLDGDQALQQRLLLSFVERHHDVLQKVDALLEANNTDQAVDLIHTLKGVAANLGASALSEVSRIVIDELRAGTGIQSRTHFEQTLAETLRLIQKYIAKLTQQKQASLQPDSTISLNDTLSALAPFIRGYEIVPDSLMEEMASLAAANLPESHLLGQMLVCIDNFDHDKALELFELLRSGSVSRHE